MGVFEKMMNMANEDLTYSQKLYRLLKDREFSRYPYRKVGLGYGMSCIVDYENGEELATHLINHGLKEAYEIMDANHCIEFVKSTDFALGVNNINVCSPVRINPFVGEEALFEWNTREDGRVYEDEQGFGIISSDPNFIYGVINKNLEVIVPFQYIDERKVEHYRNHPMDLAQLSKK